LYNPFLLFQFSNPTAQFPGSPHTQHPGKSKLLACESLGIRQLLLQPTQFPGSDTMIPSWLLHAWRVTQSTFDTT